MNLEQLLDPARLAEIWANRTGPAREPQAEPGDADDTVVLPLRASVARPARAASEPAEREPFESELAVSEPAAAPGDDVPLSADVPVTAPSVASAFHELERAIAAVFASGSQEHAIARELLDPMAETLAAGGVSMGDIDQLEDLLDALLAAKGWPMDEEPESP